MLASSLVRVTHVCARRAMPRRLSRTAPGLTTIVLVAGVVLFSAPASALAADTTVPSEPGTITVSNVTATGLSEVARLVRQRGHRGRPGLPRAVNGGRL